MLAYDFVTNGQAEPGPLGLGSKERGEQFPQDLFRDSLAGISNGYSYNKPVVRLGNLRRKRKRPPAGHRLECVQDKIEEYLLNLLGIDVNIGQIFGNIQFLFYELPTLVLGSKNQGLFEDLVYVGIDKLRRGW